MSRKYKLIEGIHATGGKVYASKKAQKTSNISGEANFAGDILESETNLVLGYPGKFITLAQSEAQDEMDELNNGDSEGGDQESDDDPDFESMNLKQLKDFAKEYNIDLGEAKSKEDVLSVVINKWSEQ